MEFSWWAALYAQLGAPYPRLSILIVALLFAGLGSGCWVLIGKDYQRQVRERAEQFRPTDETLRTQLSDGAVRLGQLETRFEQLGEAVKAEREAKERSQQALVACTD